WHQTIKAHPILRTAFAWRQIERPIQIVFKEIEPSWEVRDWSHLPENGRNSQIENLMGELREEAFNLVTAPLHRLVILKLGNDSHGIVIGYERLIMDAWSAGALINELIARCSGKHIDDKLGGACLSFKRYSLSSAKADASELAHYWQNRIQSGHS